MPVVTIDFESASWLPALCLTSAFGLFLVALADIGGWNEADWAQLLFWVGLLVLYVPNSVRLFSARPSRSERIGIIVVLGIGLYLVKLMHSPLHFTHYDELLHWRTAKDIAQTGHLFRENLLLSTSPVFPGLEIVTSALSSLSGLSIFGAGVMVIGVARLVLMLSLYVFYEEVSRSARIGGIASLLFMSNPNFLFFDAMFAYGSLALAFAALVTTGVSRRATLSGNRGGLNLAIVLGIGAVVITHHFTSYLLVVFLILWAMIPVLSFMARRLILWYAGERSSTKGFITYCKERLMLLRQHPIGSDKQTRGPLPGGMALLLLSASLVWLVYVANKTLNYLGLPFISSIREFISVLAEGEAIRQLFSGSGGTVAPIWERMVGYASVVFILLVLPMGLYHIWQQYRSNAAALTLALVALIYPISLAFRFTQAGWQLSNRLSEFLFVGVAFVLAVGIADFRIFNRPACRWCVVLTTWATIIFAGGVIVSWGSWARLPGPYLAAADARSIEPQGILAAEWARSHLEPNGSIAADRINRLLMGSFGGQRPVVGFFDTMSEVQLYLSSELGSSEKAIIQRVGIRYILIDQRLSRLLPKLGFYFDAEEPDAYQRMTPLDPATLAKFNEVENVSRVFDSGDIQIYDVWNVNR